MIFDTNISWGNWPFQHFACSAVAEMKNSLKKLGICGGLVRSAEAAFLPDLECCNQKLSEDFSGSDNFIPVPAVNPYYPEWKKLCNSGNIFAGVVYPGYHGYSVSTVEFAELAAVFAERNIILVVVVRQEDERGHHKFCRIPPVPVEEINDLARRFPRLTLICLNCYYGEFPQLLREAPNINADIAFAETLNTVKSIVEQAGRKQLVFGSHTPFFYTEAALMKLKNSGADKKIIRDIAMNNIERILQWKLR
ncbi:MAG: hypothetical protein PHV59_06880 [Victivallales bacterium]|nr:hypothetical protein [Victivallales bacterium]